MKSVVLLGVSICLLSILSCKTVDNKMVVTDHSKSPCELIPEVGPCKALIPKYFFDQASGTCKTFDWGGCQGLVPFDTLEECEAADCND